MPNNIAVDESPFDVEMRKAAAECGWNDVSERTILLRFIALTARFRPSLFGEFKSYLRGQAEEESAMVAPHPASGLEDDTDDGEDSDLDDDDDSDLDDDDDSDLDDDDSFLDDDDEDDEDDDADEDYTE